MILVRVDTTHTHGTGCFLSSAIATNLAKGISMGDSVAKAKEFLYSKLLVADRLKFDYRLNSKSSRREAII